MLVSRSGGSAQTFQFGDHCGRISRGEHRIAGYKNIRASFGQLADIGIVHSPVNFYQ